MLRRFGGWGSVWGINFGKFWCYLEGLFIEIYIGNATIQFPIRVLISVDVRWTGICNV